MCKFETRLLNLNFRYMATRKQTYTRVKQCSHVSVGLAQARPSKFQMGEHITCMDS